jgi:hypothetical protein
MNGTKDGGRSQVTAGENTIMFLLMRHNAPALKQWKMVSGISEECLKKYL